MPLMVVVTSAEDAGPLVRWGIRFAWARREPVVILYPGRGSKAPNESDRMELVDIEDAHPTRAAIRKAIADTQELLADRIEALKESDPYPDVTFRQVLHLEAKQAILNEIKALKVALLVTRRPEKNADESDLAAALLEHAPCDVLVIRATGDTGLKCDRVLIPASGGPHAPVALRLGAGLARLGVTVHPFYVEQEGGPLAENVGQRMLKRVVSEAGVDPAQENLELRVAVGDNALRGISEAVKDDYDLVLVGASEPGFMNRILYRTVPNDLLTGSEATAIAIVRRGADIHERAWAWLGGLRERLFPQIEREDRIALFARLQEGSKFNVDFLALIAMATAIAALGLLQNSGAVVIGAMLVAPLMTPMVGAGLALVQGNLILVRDALWSIALGFLTALAIGFVAGLLFGRVLPTGELNAQLLARGGPTLLDLFVAFISGHAAAYAIARPNLSGALPGVAIAAALVPPIATVGISWATGHYANGTGAALLFGTNLVAIILGAASTFRIVGVGGGRQQRGRLWVRRAYLSLILALVFLAVPLVDGLVTTITRGREVFTVTDALRRSVRTAVERRDGLRLVEVDRIRTESRFDLDVVIAAETLPDTSLASEVSQLASGILKRPIHVRVVALKYWPRDLTGQAVAKVRAAVEAEKDLRVVSVERPRGSPDAEITVVVTALTPPRAKLEAELNLLASEINGRPTPVRIIALKPWPREE